MGIRLEVKNFRCLRNVDWSPDGVCLLVGPNGSGKSTLFDALKFFWFAYHYEISRVIEVLGGFFFRNLDAPIQEAVTFGLTQRKSTWELDIPPGGGPVSLLVGERFSEGSETIFLKRPEDQKFTYRGQIIGGPGTMAALRAVTIMPTDEKALAMIPFTVTVSGLIIYGEYVLRQLRFSGSQPSTELRLESNGQNAFAVLRNWRDKRDYRRAYEFVVAQLNEAFPGVSDDLEFDFAGQVTSLRLVNRLRPQSIPVTFAPNGWLTGLLHLMAVAGTQPGTVVAIDEFENSLHPYAIRRLVKAMREWAAEKHLTVILAGHSSALLDEFKECPSQVFVMEPWRPGQSAMPRRLTDYRDPEWLKHFSLGELYRHEEFGGPKEAPSNGVPTVSA